MTDEEALALDRRPWMAYMKTLPEAERTRLRRLRQNQAQQRYREGLDEEGKEREKALKRASWAKHHTDPKTKRRRAKAERERYRKARGK